MRQLPRGAPQEAEAVRADERARRAPRRLRRGERQPLEEEGRPRRDGRRRDEGFAVLARADRDGVGRGGGDLSVVFFVSCWERGGKGGGGRCEVRGGEVAREREREEASQQEAGRRLFERRFKTSRLLSPFFYLFVVPPELALARDAREEVGHGATGAIWRRRPWPRRPRRSSLFF